MLPLKMQFEIGFVIAMAIPWVVAGFPSVGVWLYRRRRNRLLFGALVLFGLLGITLAKLGVMSFPLGVAFFFPIWQVILVLLGWHLTHRVMGRFPVDTMLNWQPDLFVDRCVVLGLLFAGFLFPAMFIRDALGPETWSNHHLGSEVAVSDPAGHPER
ncbi:MAG TPA: hypothetical protein VJ570_09190 [Holophagaceae bacterium]|nr:hypothetical protein [Holophagaceae bacterium]